MKKLLLALASLAAAACALEVPRDEPLPRKEGGTSTGALAAPSRAAKSSARRLFTSTRHVSALLAHEGSLWAATRGGIERYDPASLERVAHFTTEDGLEDNDVLSLEVDAAGRLAAATRRARCVLAAETFTCAEAEAPPVPRPRLHPELGGARVTTELEAFGRRFFGTAGRGVLAEGSARQGRVSLAAPGQIGSNHVTAVAAFAGRLYVGSFDEGISVSKDGEHFEPVGAPARMVNELVATPRALYVASGEGLFRSADGERFERVAFVSQRGVSGVAFDGRSIWATTPGALWRVREAGGPPDRAFWKPGGSTSVQGVCASEDGVWIATEDRGALRIKAGAFEIFDRASGLPTSWATDLAARPGGGVFVGTLRHGALEIFPDGRHRQVSGVPDPWVLDVSVSGDSLFVGTQGGALVLSPRGPEESIDLPNPNVHAIAEAFGALFFGTEGGLLREAGGAPPRGAARAGDSGFVTDPGASATWGLGPALGAPASGKYP